MNSLTRGLYISVSIGACLIGAGRAVAADATAPEAAASARTASSADGLEEIVVTAEKRATNLQKTPAAVTAFTGQTLVTKGIQSPLDLADLVPGVTFRTRGEVTQLFIRGVGSNVDSPQVLPSIAAQMNQMYVPREATGGSFYDLASVEVLPGPQGTLYGRDAAGGTLNINFHKPTDDWTTDALMELGNYSLIHTTVVENLPISDTLSVRGALDVNRHDGYLTNGGDDLASTSFRLSGLWKPRDDLSVLLWGSYWHDGGAGPEVVASPLIQKSNPWYIQPAVPAGSSRFESGMLGGELDWHFENLTLTYLPGYSHFEENDFESFASPALFLNAPGAAFKLHIDQDWDNYSQEVRLSDDNDGPVKWLSALYWYYQTLRYDRHQTADLSQVTSTVTTIPRQTNSGYAAYGQLTYSPTDTLHLTVGGRAASDQVNVSGQNTPANVQFGLDKDWKHFDWKVGGQFDLTDSSNIYATIQTGFLRGGYSPAALSSTRQLVPTSVVQPEKLLSYVIGTKNRFFDDHLQINDEFFYYDYKQYQISAINLVTNVSSFLNANRAVIYGNQLDTVLAITHNDKANVSIGLSHGRATDFKIPAVGDFTGYSLPNSPDITLILGYQHTFDLSSGDALQFNVDSHYESTSYLLFNHPNGSRQSPYTITDLTFTYLPVDARWDLAVWVKNIENSAVYGAGATVGPIGAVYLGAPRTFGGRFELHF